jgi:hypothetical protein
MYRCVDLGDACLTKLDCQPTQFCDKIRGRCKSWMSTSDAAQLLLQ